ncbi:MAG: hypothetical protein JXP34_13405 [Planctomycetes bacterium]|nr:hypothetical protein [Planctomycetota bacterium]
MALSHCPHCGEPVPRDAGSCWSCGRDLSTRWDPDSVDPSLQIDEDEDLAEDFGDDEYDPEAGSAPRSNAFGLLILVCAYLFVVIVTPAAARGMVAGGALLPAAVIAAIILRRGRR